MVEFTMRKLKDLGLKREVFEALPYAVVRGAWEGSLETGLAEGEYATVMSHVVPAGRQLKILFLRVWTQNTTGAIFSIVQATPEKGEPGYPVVGSAPEGVVDYPMLEAAGAEVLRGSLKDPVHVLEGSIDFRILGPVTPSGARYGVVYWGVEEVAE
jgi:hypothetical protein